MPFPQTKPSVPQAGTTPRILHPSPQWFLVRGIVLGFILPLILAVVVKARGLGLLCAMGAVILWLLFRNSSITLDSLGFTYRSPVRNITHRWVDVERFCVVEQRMFVFIPISRYLGWNYSPAYRNYKRLTIPRTVARWVGMSDAMFKPIGFNVTELTAVMNQHLAQSRDSGAEKPARMPS